MRSEGGKTPSRRYELKPTRERRGGEKDVEEKRSPKGKAKSYMSKGENESRQKLQRKSKKGMPERVRNHARKY